MRQGLLNVRTSCLHEMLSGNVERKNFVGTGSPRGHSTSSHCGSRVSPSWHLRRREHARSAIGARPWSPLSRRRFAALSAARRRSRPRTCADRVCRARRRAAASSYSAARGKFGNLAKASQVVRRTADRSTDPPWGRGANRPFVPPMRSRTPAMARRRHEQTGQRTNADDSGRWRSMPADRKSRRSL